MLAAAARRAGLAGALLAATTGRLRFAAPGSFAVGVAAAAAEHAGEPFREFRPAAFLGPNRRRLRRSHGAHGRLFARGHAGLDFLLADHRFDFFAVDHRVGGFFHLFGSAQALDFVTRRFHQVVGHDGDRRGRAALDAADDVALFVEQEVGHRQRRLDDDPSGVFLHGLFFGQPDQRQRERFDRADRTVTIAAWAGNVAGFSQRGAQALARQLEQAEARDPADLHARLVGPHGFAQLVFHVALGFAAVHVDEVDHDQAAQVAQTQLARDFLRGLQVGLQRGLLDVGALGRARGVDVDREQRLGMVDDHRAAGGQTDFPGERRFDLRLDLEAREQRCGVVVALEFAQVVRHDLLKKIARVLEDLLRVDQDFADVFAHVVAQRANDHVAFLVDQERRLARAGRGLDGFPQLDQVIQIPLQIFGFAAHPCGAHDQAHALRCFELAQRIENDLAVLAGNLARHAPGAWIVRHQHQVASGQANEGGQRRALGAALLLFDLDDDFLAAFDRILDVDALPGVQRLGRRFGEIFAGDFLERQKAVAFGAELDEAGFEAGLDARDASLVDVGLFLFLGGHLDIEVDQVLAIGDGDTQLFGLSCVDQHSFHCLLNS